MRLRSSFAVVLLFASAILPASDRFEVASLNFGVSTPAHGWRWSKMKEERDNPGGGACTVTSPDDEQFTVSASAPGMRPVTTKWMNEFRLSVEKQAAHDGTHISSFHFERATAPIYPSYIYSYVVSAKDGRTAYVDGYVATLNRTYTIQYPSANRRRLDDFHHFIQSFAVLDRLESQRGSAASPAAAAHFGNSGLDSTLGRTIGPNGQPAGTTPGVSFPN